MCMMMVSVFTDCKKIKRGCTEPHSPNYDAEAEEDDGSCVPYGFFWATDGDPCVSVSMSMGGEGFDPVCGCTIYSNQRCDLDWGAGCSNKIGSGGPLRALPPGTYNYTVYEGEPPYTIIKTGTGTIVDGECFVVYI